MEEMGAVFELTDELEIWREKIEVPLLCEGDGNLRRLDNGKLEITLPETEDPRAWIQASRALIVEIAGDLLGSSESR